MMLRIKVINKFIPTAPYANSQLKGKEEAPTVVNLSDYLSNMAELKASFLATIKSAIQHVFAADIRFAEMPFSDKVLFCKSDILIKTHLLLRF